jgi:hypothetical protein
MESYKKEHSRISESLRKHFGKSCKNIFTHLTSEIPNYGFLLRKGPGQFKKF